MNVFLNGDILPIDQARIDPGDRGFLLADGVFETVLAVDGTPIFLSQHLDRLENSATAFNIPLPLPRESFQTTINQLLTRNHLTQGQASIRITLSRGVGPRGLLPPAPSKPTLLITAESYMPVDIQSCLIIDTYRIDQSSPLCGIKSLNYQIPILARHHAHSQNYEEVLLLNYHHHLVSASSANLFMIQDGALITPSLQDGALPGIVRSMVLDISRVEKIPVHIKSIALKDLTTIQAAFLTNSLMGVRTIQSIKQINDKEENTYTFKPSPVLEKIKQLYEKRLLVEKRVS